MPYEYEPVLPDGFVLSQNYPNPFNPSTEIEFGVPSRQRVSVRVFSTLGQEVRTLVEGELSAGTYRVTWDGRDSRGAEVSLGGVCVHVDGG